MIGCLIAPATEMEAQRPVGRHGGTTDQLEGGGGGGREEEGRGDREGDKRRTVI